MNYLLIKIKQMRVLVRQFDKTNQLGISKKVIMVVLLLLLIPFRGLSQNESTIISKSQFETGISQQRNVIGKFKTFSRSLNPSIYVENNQIKVSDANPSCLHIDYASVAAIDATITNKRHIEYVSVRIKNDTGSENQSSIILSQLSDFKDLKYIHLIFEYDITDSEIESLISNPSIDCFIIYESRKIM